MEADVQVLLRLIRNNGEFNNPIWVAKGSYVILNGHHRTETLRRLGAVRIPAWMMDYHGSLIRLDRWSPGEPISKHEVEERAKRGELFPPKTTRHHLLVEPPPRRIFLADLLPPGVEGPPRWGRAALSVRSGARGPYTR